MSLSLMRECAYDSAFMFKKSERPGTYASKHLPDDVPEEVKIRRLNEMIELQNQLSAESNARDVGKTFEVLVEGVSKRSKEQLFGRTEQNKVVVFDRGTHRIGDLVRVRITESSSATLKCIEVTELPQTIKTNFLFIIQNPKRNNEKKNHAQLAAHGVNLSAHVRPDARSGTIQDRMEKPFGQ